MKTCSWKLWVAGAFALWGATVTHAIPITVAFTATGFIPLVGSIPAPDDPVIGTIIYDAASISSPIDSLTSISLAISGHTYAIGDIGSFSDSGIAYIGGLIDGVLGSGNFENDFLIVWDMTTLVPLQFLYATLDSSGIWYTLNFSQFSVTTSLLPEPSLPALLVLGLLGIVATRRIRS